MRAIFCTAYGPPEVLELREVPTPQPKPGQVLIRIHAATVTLGDCEVRAFKMVDWIWLPARLAFGVTRPRNPVLGMEIAGDIAALGEGVDRFRVGDRVFGSTGFAMGAYADFAVLPQTAGITTIPPELSYAEAAGIPTGGLNGLHFVRECAVRPGERVLVNGAGGSIGMFALQLAKAAGAIVTAVDRNEKHAMLRGLGADAVLDYRECDFWATGARYDVVIDVVGTSPFGPTAACIESGGRYVLGNPRAGQMLAAMLENRRGRIRAHFKLAGEPIEDLEYLKSGVAGGALRVVIDRSWPLEAIAEAHRYVESGRKTGIAMIDVSGAAYSRPGEAAQQP